MALPQPDASIRVIIADDHTLFINGLSMLLQNEKDIEVIAAASNGKEALSILHEKTPDVLLLDINMPGFNGFDVLKRVKALYPKMRVIMLSTYNESQLVDKAKAEGADGYLFKNAEKDELVTVLRKVASGEQHFPMQREIITSTFNGADPFLKQFQLTKREVELLQLIKQNLTNQQIADKLFLSIYTVETHRKNIMQKLNLHNPVELTRFIIQYNL